MSDRFEKDFQKVFGNPVAKNMNKFNKPATHKDRKKAEKRGETKYGTTFPGSRYPYED